MTSECYFGRSGSIERILVLAAVVAGLAAEADAQAIQNIVLRNSFSPIGAGARGLGMGGAFIAVADDGTASSFNPAGLAQLRRSEISIVGFTSSLRSTIANSGRAALPDVTRTDRHQAPDFFGVAVPFEAGGRNLTVQLSYQRSVDLFGRGSATLFQSVETAALVEQGLIDDALVSRLRLPAFSSLVLQATPEQTGAFHTASLAFGYQTTDRLSLGLALNYWFANWTAEGSSITRLVTTAGATQATLDLFRAQTTFNQEQSVRALSANFGALLKFKRVSFGATARLPFTGDYDLRETGSVVAMEAGRAAITTRNDQETRTRLRWPRSLGAGVAFRPFSKFTLSGDISKTHWSRAVIEGLPGGALLTETATGAAAPTDRNFFDLVASGRTTTEDTSQWRAGAEFLLATSRVIFPLRAGVYQDRSPISDLSTNRGRLTKGLTAGIGINFQAFVFDVGFERRRSDGTVGLRVTRATAVGAPVSNASSLSAEKVRDDRLVASLIYRFKGGDDDPLRRLFRFLFVGESDAGDEGGSTR